MGETKLPQKILAEARTRGYESLLLRARLVVGVSGGADSLALLHILCVLRGDNAGQTLHAAHLEHGFRGDEGKVDAEFVAQVATDWGVPFTLHHVDVPALAEKHRLSDEDAARRVRYGFFAALAKELDAIVAVAHTADDQAETVLMSIMRGAGLKGLAGMQPLSTLRFSDIVDEQYGSEGTHTHGYVVVQVFRPMLGVWREQVEQYCMEQGLRPRTDPTNAQQTYLRNRIRHDLLPYLQTHYSPSIKARLNDLADVASAEDNLMEQYVDGAWQEVAHHDYVANVVIVDTTYFSQLHPAMQRRIARRAISLAAGTLDGITFGHVAETLSILAGGVGSAPQLDLPHEVSVERVARQAIMGKRAAVGQAWLHLARESRPLISPDLEIEIKPQNIVMLEDGWSLRCETVQVVELQGEPGELVAHFDQDTLPALGPFVLRTRRRGDSIQPFGMAGRKSLQDLYVDAKIPRALRERIPVVALADSSDVLWVVGPGGRRSAQAMVGPETRRVLRLAFIRA